MSKKHRSSGAAWLISYPVIAYRREEAVDCASRSGSLKWGESRAAEGGEGQYHIMHHAVEQKARRSPWPVEELGLLIHHSYLGVLCPLLITLSPNQSYE